MEYKNSIYPPLFKYIEYSIIKSRFITRTNKTIYSIIKTK